MMLVRKATASDIPWLLEKLRDHDELMGYKRKLFADENFARNALIILLDRHVIFIAKEDGKNFGFIAGHLAGHPFNPAIRVLSEILWWTEPSFRGKRAASVLLSSFTKFGYEHVDSIICSHVYDKTGRASALEKRGYRELERAYLLEV